MGTGACGASYHTHDYNAVVCAGCPTQRHPWDIIGCGPAERTAPCVADAQGLGCRVRPALRCSKGKARRACPDSRLRDRRWCFGRGEGCEVAAAGLIIGLIIGRNEIILNHCRRSDIETCHLSQRDEDCRRAGRERAGLLTALIDAISCQIRFSIGGPGQRGTPRGTRPQHKNGGDGSYPVQAHAPLTDFSAAATPIPESVAARVQVSM